MTQYSSYTDNLYVTTAVMYLKINAIVGGQYLDYSGNDFHADVVTITDADDGIKLADNDDLREYLRPLGIYNIFYDSDDTPKEVLKSQIGRIYNNTFFNNDIYMIACGEPLTGGALFGTTNFLFGAYDADALNIIFATGVTSELKQRLIDTHVKDLKAINILQAGFIAFGDPDNSAVKVLYGIMGSVIGMKKYNWINPVDTDAGNRLELAAGSEPPERINMIDYDGRGCHSMNFNATILGSDNSFSFYSLFNFNDGYVGRDITPVSNCYDMGCLGSAAGLKGIDLKVRNSVGVHSINEDTYQNPSKGIQYDAIDSSGLFFTNKATDNDLKEYRNGIQIGVTVIDAGISIYYDGNIILGGCSIDGIIDIDYSVLACGYSHMGDKIDTVALKPFQDAIMRYVSSKSYYFFSPDETAMV